MDASVWSPRLGTKHTTRAPLSARSAHAPDPSSGSGSSSSSSSRRTTGRQGGESPRARNARVRHSRVRDSAPAGAINLVGTGVGGDPVVPDADASHGERLAAAEGTLRDMEARRQVMRERATRMLQRAAALEKEQQSWKQALADIEDVAVSPRDEDAKQAEGTTGEQEGKQEGKQEGSQPASSALDAELERLEQEALRAYEAEMRNRSLVDGDTDGDSDSGA